MRISDWSSDVCSSDLDHVAGERVAVVHEAVPGLLAGRKAGVVARGHHMGLGADAQGEPALEEKEMLLLEDVPVRWRTLLARRQFLDRHADTIAVAKRGEAEVSVAHGKARHVGPLRPRDVGRGDGPGW